MRIDEPVPDGLAMPTRAPKKVVMSRTAFVLVCVVCGGAGAVSIVAWFHARPPSTLTTPPPPSTLSSFSALQPRYPGWASANLLMGRPAPELTLVEITNGREVRLSSFRGRKPVVLIFGSSRCGNFSDQADLLEDLYRAYRDRAEFLFVYIDPRLPPATGQPGDRREQARQTMASLKLTMPCVLDTRHGDTDKMYLAWPQRLVIVGVDGRIALDAGCGLWEGWDLAAVETWLKQFTR
jgi:hypothetical protein